MTRPDDPDPTVIARVAAHAFPRGADLVVERISEGVSTYVYRIRRGDAVYYLRVLPEVGSGFAPEARVHGLLRERGVKAPEVVYLEHRNPDLGLSVMVTTDAPGQHIGHCRDARALRSIMVEAGRDLALINSIRVQGFGWIKRDRAAVVALEAELPTLRAFALDPLEDDLTLLGQHALTAREVDALRAAIGRADAWPESDGVEGRLAHGDFDAAHIYQQDGRYSGIIDFGEIRGADPFYDLGHVRMHDGETLPLPLLPYLLEGYAQIAPLPADGMERIRLACLLIATKTLARRIRKSAAFALGADRYAELCVRVIRRELHDG